jgi:methyltransferase (TIGR00027 family)
VLGLAIHSVNLVLALDAYYLYYLNDVACNAGPAQLPRTSERTPRLMTLAEHRLSHDFGAVQETLLIPLYMRAKETSRPDGICRDYKAVQIIRLINYDFGKFDEQGASIQLDIAVRTEIMDEVVAGFVSHHPDGLVANLGAGLDARFYRLDNGRVVWVELDLPEVIDLRRKFFRESLRNPFLPRSVLEEGWLEDLCRRKDQPMLLLAEGLLPYLPPDAVWQLFDRIAERLPGADVVFQSISPDLIHQQHLVPAVNQTRATFEWGICSGREVVERDERYELVGEWSYLDRHPERWEEVLRRWWFAGDIREQMRKLMHVTHLRVHRRGESRH